MSFHFFSLFVLFFLLSSTAHSQVAGLNTLTLLDLSSSARSAGLGMDYLALYSDEPALALDNPSLLRREMCGVGSLSFVSLFEGSMTGSLAYGHDFGRIGPLLFAFRFNNYGSFDGYDEQETSTGRFSAADYALSVGWGTWLDSSFTVGVNFKPVLSHYERYTAMAVAFDLAASWFSTDRQLVVSALARNVGAQVLTFDGTMEKLPFELTAEVSYKLKRAPFRVFFAATELQRWNLAYEDPHAPTTTYDYFSGEVTSQSALEAFADNLFRHALFGVELGLGKSFFARLGYSYRQTAEMSGFEDFNLSGFSFGLTLRKRHFEFSYARRNYHLSQAPNFFTLSYRF